MDILEPQVCAIGISAVQERRGVYVNEEKAKLIGIRKFLPICIAFDHWALDYGEIVPFINEMDAIFAVPEIIQLW